MSAAIWKMAAAVMTFDVDGGGELHLEHAGGQSGGISADDLLNGRMRVVDRRTKEVSEYESVEYLVTGGWHLVDPVVGTGPDRSLPAPDGGD